MKRLEFASQGHQPFRFDPAEEFHGNSRLGLAEEGPGWGDLQQMARRWSGCSSRRNSPASDAMKPTRGINRFLPVLFIVRGITPVLSGIITFINLGLADRFLARWLQTFLAALPVISFRLIVMATLEKPLLRALGTRLPAFAIISKSGSCSPFSRPSSWSSSSQRS